MKTRAAILLLLVFCVLNGHAQIEQVIFSAPGGFYEDAFSLSLNCFYPDHLIRYTVNGNKPTSTSPCYSSPLFLDEQLYSTSNIYTIQNAPSFLFYEPDSVSHAIVIRAAVFDEAGKRLSDVATNTYLIQGLGCDTHGLPVLSITADSLDLFDYETGILVPGIHYNPLDSLCSGNYYQSGMEWERRVHVEFYEPDGSPGISQDAGLRTHGGTGRRGPQKGLKLYAREEYGTKRFNHAFFSELPIDSYKHLVLRPFTCQWFSVGIQDDICNRLASNLNVESVCSRPAVLFLNGEYWGIYYIKEKPDSHYLEDHFGIEDTTFNVIEDWYGTVANGDSSNFLSMMNWLSNSNLTLEDDYETISALVDLDCFIDYYCLELFIANNDWPANNMRCYQHNNGIWRWIFFDGDDCLAKMDFDVFDNATSVTGVGWPTHPTATLMFRKLLENPSFYSRFFSRFNNLLSTVFNYSNTKPLLDASAARVRDEIPQQVGRYGRPLSVDSWNYYVWRIDLFLQQREDHIREQINTILSTTTHYYTNASVSPNPNRGSFTVTLMSEGDVKSMMFLYDLSGHKVYSQQVSLNAGENLLHFEISLNPGIYLLNIDSFTKKIVKY